MLVMLLMAVKFSLYEMFSNLPPNLKLLNIHLLLRLPPKKPFFGKGRFNESCETGVGVTNV